jgi:hypothetical protein
MTSGRFPPKNCRDDRQKQSLKIVILGIDPVYDS